MIDFTNLRTVKQLAEECPALTDRIIYHWLEERDSNGLSAAVVPIGRRILIDVRRFNEWLEAHRAS